MKRNRSSNISTVSMVNVGQGDGFIIKLSTGQTVYIDVGENYKEFDKNKINSEISKSNYLDFISQNIFSRNTVDLVLITHDDSDHVGAVVGLSKNERVGAYGLSPLKYTYIQKVKRVNKFNEDKTLILNYMVSGFKIDFGNNNNLNIIYPDINRLQKLNVSKESRASNSASLVTKLSINDFKILFTGDIGFKDEKYLVDSNYDLSSDMLKIAHHGSKGSSDIDFLKSSKPYISLISSGYKNRYGHPHKTVIDRLLNISKVSHINIYRTDICGTVLFSIYKNGAVGRRDCK